MGATRADAPPARAIYRANNNSAARSAGAIIVGKSIIVHQAVIAATGLYTPDQSISNAELVEAFNAIENPRSRNALMHLARSMADGDRASD